MLIAGGRRKVPGELATLIAGVFRVAKGPHAGQPDGAAGALDRVVAATCLAKLHSVQACRQIVLNPRGCACARQTFTSTEAGPPGFIGQHGYGRQYINTRLSQRSKHFHLPKAALIWPRIMAAAMRMAAATMFAGPRISLRSARLRLGTPQREKSTLKYTTYSTYIPPKQTSILENYCAGSSLALERSPAQRQNWLYAPRNSDSIIHHIPAVMRVREVTVTLR